MNIIILLFGILIVLSGAALLIGPGYVFDLLKKYRDSSGLYLFAIAARVILGAVLVIGASGSKFPVAFQVIGWFSIFAALALVGIGRARFQRLIDWALGLVGPYGRFAGFFVVLLGGFLIYAVL